ncbi:sushi, von Willebrand factor type A, EGF and pentraxin domain-containing protein 1-like isoform X3 [Biomphalaria glabrata]|uniref:Sushi, von Willebrand factor type A, EGF and pentraxin domain-containing protein 1-like isoform X3 n=1 Tax=Biomphalaria glabrata TaxID=6526 RepID=A0A9W2YVE2_BIOGL|nr:sushi, von Willebrand factor type A, EGF and pentraxin domain-containing protein 1-like isoform X3 [Biomphalaria glabrata]
MLDGSIPKDIIYAELAEGVRPKERPRLTYSDVCKRDMRATGIDQSMWEEIAQDWTEWTRTVRADVCAVGQEYKDYNCSDCDIGFYKDTNGNTNCTKCPINKITLGKGSTSDSNCTITFCGPGFFTSDNITCYKCYKGTYKETTGNNRCTQCPKHKTTLTEGSNSRESCNSTFCDRGTSTTDNITCVDCANGTYKSSPGNQPCTPCPGNKTTFNFGSTDQRNCSITHCDKGFFQSENGLCSVCPNGTYKNFTGNQPCSKCPMNKTTLNVGSTDISNCSLDCATICGKNDPCRDTGTSTCVCKSGYYGPECSKRCSPGCLNTSCSKNNGSCPCKEGYYGAKCLKTGYLDRNNRWSDHYVQKNCSEQICPCSLGWFGQSCQYRDLGVEAIMDNQVLNDNNDSTCGKQNNVTVDWLEEIHAITWIRLVFTSNDNITELEANYFEDHSSEPSFTCGHHSLKIHKTGNTAIDLHCVNSFFIRLLKVSWNSDSPLCSVYVSGERNVALGSRRAKWILNERRAITINTLTDGDYANNGCLKMNSSVTLEITLWNSIYSSEIRLFTDFTKNNGTGFFRIEIFDEYSDTEYKISSSGQDLYVQRAFFMNIFIFNFVKIRVLYGTLHLCEVEIFGDCHYPRYGFSCLEVCYLTCLDQICTFEGECYLCIPGRTGVFCENRTVHSSDDILETARVATVTRSTHHSVEANQNQKSHPMIIVMSFFTFLCLIILFYFVYKNYTEKKEPM